MAPLPKYRYALCTNANKKGNAQAYLLANIFCCVIPLDWSFKNVFFFSADEKMSYITVLRGSPTFDVSSSLLSEVLLGLRECAAEQHDVRLGRVVRVMHPSKALSNT
eukprot:GEMP01045449.1.p1 GENE.GEMP01045449.1~~GEMP01045449.1.p1  ORF type:complete len:107 (-),score=9.37 GEMP01045449.1:224-544(-)